MPVCRQAKATLLDTGVPRLEKLAKKGKKLTPDIANDRLQKVQQVKDGIANIPDGLSGNRKPRKVRTTCEDLMLDMF